MKISVSVVAVICTLAGGFATVPAAPVQAQGLFQRLFNPTPRYTERRDTLRKEEALAEARKVRVTGPRYYGYTPDKMINASFASLAEVDTASNDPAAVPEAVTTPFASASVHLSSYRMRTLEPVAAAIKAHYLKKPDYIWVSDGKVNAKARAAMAELARADAYGLSPRDYDVLVPADATAQ